MFIRCRTRDIYEDEAEEFLQLSAHDVPYTEFIPTSKSNLRTCTVVYADENTRDAGLIKLRSILRNHQSELRAIPCLTQLEASNKHTVYSTLKPAFPTIEIGDWGNKVAIWKLNEQGIKNRTVIRLSQAPTTLAM